MAPKEAENSTETIGEAFWRDFIKEAPYLDGNAQEWSLPQDIPWFDKDRYHRGALFTKEYFFLHAYLIFLGTIVGGIIKPMMGVFFRDHQLYPENGLFERSLKGLKFWMSCTFDNDMTDIRSLGTKGVRTVRGIHSKHAVTVDNRKKLLPLPDHLIPKECHDKAKEIRELFEDVPTPDVPAELTSWYPPLPFSQYAVSLAAFGVWVPFWTIPVIKNNLPGGSDPSDFMHNMALGPRVLGLLDKYNFALCRDPALYEKGMRFVFYFLKDIDATAYFIMEPSFRILSKVGMTPNVIFHLTAEQAGVNCKKLWDRTSFMEKINVHCSNRALYFYMTFRPFRLLMNILSKVVFKVLFLIFLTEDKDSRYIRKRNAKSSYYQ